MNDPADTDAFRLPRLSRLRTRPRDADPRWSEWLVRSSFAALLVLSFGSPWMTDQGSAVLGDARQAGYAAILVLTVIAIRPWRHPERLAVVPWPVLLALGFCWLSVAWAAAPDVAVRRLALTSIVLWSLYALVHQLGSERATWIMRWLLAVLLVANFAVAILYPTVGIHGPDEGGLAGDWRGIMDQKNFAGFASAMTIIVWAFGPGRVPLWGRIAAAVASTLFLVLSDSATSVAMCLVALGVGGGFLWAARMRGQRRLAPPGWAWLVLLPAAGVAASMVFDPDLYMRLLSDPAGFTGRTQIWTSLIKVFDGRPLLGVGYGSVWDLGPASPLIPYAPDWVVVLSQGHEGYLDLLAQVGIVGTLLILFAVLAWPLERLLRGGDDPARVLGATMLVFCLGHNLTESSLFDRDTLGQVFLMIAIGLLWGATAAAVPGRRDSGRRRSRGQSGEGRRRRRVRGAA